MIHKVMEKNLYHHLLVLNFTSPDFTENFGSNKMIVKGFSICESALKFKTLPIFAILGLLVGFLKRPR